MKNIKLTLATLTILAMSISGSALANNWDSSKHYKNQKSTVVSKKAAKKIIKVVPQKKIQYVSKKNIKKNIKQRYSIRSGDTLYRIALKTGVSMDRLAKLNRLNKHDVRNLRIGQILILG